MVELNIFIEKNSLKKVIDIEIFIIKSLNH